MQQQSAEALGLQLGKWYACSCLRCGATIYFPHKDHTNTKVRCFSCGNDLDLFEHDAGFESAKSAAAAQRRNSIAVAGAAATTSAHDAENGWFEMPKIIESNPPAALQIQALMQEEYQQQQPETSSPLRGPKSKLGLVVERWRWVGKLGRLLEPRLCEDLSGVYMVGPESTNNSGTAGDATNYVLPQLRALQLRSGCVPTIVRQRVGLVFFHGNSWFFLVPLLLLIGIPLTEFVFLFDDDDNVEGEFVALYSVIAFAICALIKLVVTDPGYMPPVDVTPTAATSSSSTAPDVNAMTKWCGFCGCYRPRLSSHCTVCQMCVEGMDHHCHITGTCIGKRNHRIFATFVTLSLVAAVWSFKLLIEAIVEMDSSMGVVDVLALIACGVILLPAITGLLNLAVNCFALSCMGSSLVQYKKFRARQKRKEEERRALLTGAMPPQQPVEDDSYVDHIDFGGSCDKYRAFWTGKVPPSRLEAFLVERKRQQLNSLA